MLATPLPICRFDGEGSPVRTTHTYADATTPHADGFATPRRAIRRDGQRAIFAMPYIDAAYITTPRHSCRFAACHNITVIVDNSGGRRTAHLPRQAGVGSS